MLVGFFPSLPLPFQVCIRAYPSLVLPLEFWVLSDPFQSAVVGPSLWQSIPPAPQNLSCRCVCSAHRPPLLICLPHDLGPFVLLCLLGELLFAFHITGPVSIESAPLCVVSNADTHIAIVFLDFVVFFLISFSSQFLSQASSLIFLLSPSYLIFTDRVCSETLRL